MSQKPNSDAEDILSELDSNPEIFEKVSNSDSLSEPIISDVSTQNQEDSSEKKPSVQKQETNNRSKTRSVILIGKKPLMTYVNSTLTQLSSLPFVTITARGKTITTAVDVSQFILKRMSSVGYKINDVRISSDSLISNDGKKRNVSSIEIDIMRN
jgi:DNA-binding protein|tara:strand:- start:1575 stop:2039 length:465 start_codon:yes stop_codon:yes gene_type:complete